LCLFITLKLQTNVGCENDLQEPFFVDSVVMNACLHEMWGDFVFSCRLRSLKHHVNQNEVKTIKLDTLQWINSKF